MKEIHLWNFIYSELKKNNKVIFAAVVDHKKGSPGKQGFKMAVSSNGEMVGSIGGGVMEYDFLKKCNKAFKENLSLNEIETLHHKNTKSLKSSGLICSGSQTNFIINLTNSNLPEIKKVIKAFEDKTPGLLVLSLAGIKFSQTRPKTSIPKFIFSDEHNWKYEQPLGISEKVYIVGGGHVGQAVSRVLSMLDFYVILLDDRSNLKSFSENKYADELISGSYNKLGKIIENNSYVVIVTTGFETDKEALTQIINKDLKYIGLMGTMSKIKKIFSEAEKEGIKKEQFKKIHAPIGIDIGSDTPEEIAISIAAELIKFKNQ
jgi:xanthine dehydrogenase accessory factor